MAYDQFRRSQGVRSLFGPKTKTTLVCGRYASVHHIRRLNIGSHFLAKGAGRLHVHAGNESTPTLLHNVSNEAAQGRVGQEWWENDAEIGPPVEKTPWI